MVYYFLSKILPLIFLPVGLISICLFFYILNKKKYWLYKAFFLLIFFSNGVVSHSLLRIIEKPWERFEIAYLQNADGIVVLSGGLHSPLGDSKIVEWNDPDRFLAGIEIYKSGKAKNLIFTGGINLSSPDLPLEGDFYIQEAISLGVPIKHLSTTNSVYNTLQEAKEVKKLLNKKIIANSQRIILVTSAFHMKRAKKVFERQGISVQAYPVDFKSSKNSFSKIITNPLNWIPNSSDLNKSSFVIREILGRLFYKI